LKSKTVMASARCIIAVHVSVLKIQMAIAFFAICFSLREGCVR